MPLRLGDESCVILTAADSTPSRRQPFSSMEDGSALMNPAGPSTPMLSVNPIPKINQCVNSALTLILIIPEILSTRKADRVKLPTQYTQRPSGFEAVTYNAKSTS